MQKKLTPSIRLFRDWFQGGCPPLFPGVALFFRELQFDATVAAQRIFRLTGRQGLELAKSGGDEPLRRHALRDEKFNDRNRARG